MGLKRHNSNFMFSNFNCLNQTYNGIETVTNKTLTDFANKFKSDL